MEYPKKLVEDFVSLLEKIDFNLCISGHSEIMTRNELFESLSL